jgi:hypothetical protein
MIEAGELVCDVINDFLVKMDPHLSHGWQLAYTAGEKWSLKNEQKVYPTSQLTQWMNVQSVSNLVGTSPLRAMKVTPRILSLINRPFVKQTKHIPHST